MGSCRPRSIGPKCGLSGTDQPIVTEVVEMDEMDQGEHMSRKEKNKVARREPQSTSIFRGRTQKEESTSETQKVPERRN